MNWLLVSEQVQLSRKIDDILNDIKFLCELVVGPRTHAAPSTDLSGDPGLLGLPVIVDSLVDDSAQPVVTPTTGPKHLLMDKML